MAVFRAEFITRKRHHTFVILRTAFALLLPAALWGATYEIQPDSGSAMELSVEKTGLLSGKKHRLVFPRYRGTLSFAAANPEASTVAIHVEAGSLACEDTWLGEKDRAKVQAYGRDDMLNSRAYPLIVFQSTSIRRIDGARFAVAGTLRIRDVTKPAVVTAQLDGGDNDALSLRGSAQIRLTDFGLKPPKAALGTIGTKDEMTLTFD